MHTKYTEYFAYRDNIFVQFSIFFFIIFTRIIQTLYNEIFKKKLHLNKQKFKELFFESRSIHIIIQIDGFVAAPTL